MSISLKLNNRTVKLDVPSIILRPTLRGICLPSVA